MAEPIPPNPWVHVEHAMAPPGVPRDRPKVDGNDPRAVMRRLMERNGLSLMEAMIVLGGGRGPGSGTSMSFVERKMVEHG